MLPDEVTGLAEALLARAKAAGMTIATAESCTAGLIAGAISEIAGSSAVLDRGFITYSNQAKMEMLGVSQAVLESHGAVSAPVAAAMADGARVRSGCELAISVTGIAGPGGATATKPVGLVWFGLARKERDTVTLSHNFTGDRAAVRRQTVMVALGLLTEACDA